MYLAIVFFIVIIFLGLWLQSQKTTKENMHIHHIVLLIMITLGVRIVGITLDISYDSDIHYFKNWSSLLFEDGFGMFYLQDAHTDYPPLYMYVLYILGAISHFFNIPTNSITYTFLIKLPAVLADLGVVILLYTMVSKEKPVYTKDSTKWSTLWAYLPGKIALFYALNPMSIINSSMWGQVDSILIFLLLLSFISLVHRNLEISSLWFALACLFKPQAAMFTPIYLLVWVHHLYSCVPRKEAWLDFLQTAISAIFIVVAVILPFGFSKEGFSLLPVLRQYIGTLSQYAYASLNAYNFYTLIGVNWVSSGTTFLSIPLEYWAYFLLFLITIISFYLLQKDGQASNIFLVACFLNLSTFMFSVKMHERYSLPILAFMLAAYIANPKKEYLRLFGGMTIWFTANIIDVFYWAKVGYSLEDIFWSSRIISAFGVLVYIYFIFVLYQGYKDSKDSFRSLPNQAWSLKPLYITENINTPVFEEPLLNAEENTDSELSLAQQEAFLKVATELPKEKTWQDYFISTPLRKIEKKDMLLVLVITLLYALIGFYQLGDKQMPETHELLKENQRYEFTWETPVYIDKMTLFLGHKTNQAFDMEIFDEENKLIATEDNVEIKGVFKWHFTDIQTKASKIVITPITTEFFIRELGFLDEDAHVLQSPKINIPTPFLFDEHAQVAAHRTYMNGTYFDEVYHARTAYEFVAKEKVYETTHPPLGKVIISWGIQLFGNNPFGWRFFGTLAGVLMVPIMYLFAFHMFSSRKAGILASLLISLDFMHFAQTRIATIDSFLVLFVLIMYYAMFLYIRTENTLSVSKSKKPYFYLFVSGLFMGLAVSTKWSGVYAGIGLAVIFFAYHLAKWQVYKEAKKDLLLETNEEQKLYTQHFTKNTLQTFGLCVIFFILIPLSIYCLSYIPYFNTGNLYRGKDFLESIADTPFSFLGKDGNIGKFFGGIIQNQLGMFSYHSELVSTHPYASHWFTWIFNIRPVYLYAASFGDNIRAGISTFGNPLIWWAGFLAIIIGLFELCKKKNSSLSFLLLAYTAQLLPWIFVTRTTYMYHYFPATIFLILLLVYVLITYIPNKGVVTYMVLTVGVFILFYPVISGRPVDCTWAHRWLKWLPTWPIC